jgi:type IV pilus assembly protein PilC
VYVVPQLAGFLTGMGQSLPPQTRALLGCADLLKAYGLPAALGLGLLAIGAFTAIRSNTALATAFDRLCLRLPGFGPVLGKLALGRMCRVCAVLYAAGIPLPAALRLTRGVLNNRALRAALVVAEEQIDAGVGLHGAFSAAQIFPDLLLRMLRVGEHSGRLDEALGQVAECFASDARETVARLQTLLNPALVGVLGLVLLWIVWAVFEPLYGLLTHLRV